MRLAVNSQGDVACIEVFHTAVPFFNVKIDRGDEPPVRLQIAHTDTLGKQNRTDKPEAKLIEDLLWSSLARYGFTKQDALT
jgi:hypothetical protein